MYLQVSDLQKVVPGLPRGAISEVLGDASSGRTALLHAFLAAATTGGEVSAVVDFANSFDPASAGRAGVDLNKLLWVQCNRRMDHAMKAADLILHGGGFGLVVLDLCEAPPETLQRVPLSYWHRFRLSVKDTPTTLVVAGNQPNARSCAMQQIELEPVRADWPGRAPFQLLGGLRLKLSSRKPVLTEPAELRAAAVGE